MKSPILSILLSGSSKALARFYVSLGGDKMRIAAVRAYFWQFFWWYHSSRWVEIKNIRFKCCQNINPMWNTSSVEQTRGFSEALEILNAENSRKAGLQAFGVKILNPPDHRSVATVEDKLGNVTKQRGFKVFRNFFNFITALIKKKFDRLHNRPHSPEHSTEITNHCLCSHWCQVSWNDNKKSFRFRENLRFSSPSRTKVVDNEKSSWKLTFFRF